MLATSREGDARCPFLNSFWPIRVDELVLRFGEDPACLSDHRIHILLIAVSAGMASRMSSA
jgi:hypothetical protein